MSNAGREEQRREVPREARAAGSDISTANVPGDAQGGDVQIGEGGGRSTLAERGSGSAEHSGSVEKGAAPSSPTKEKWVYSADALKRDLGNIPTKEKDIPQLVSAVKDVCEQHGVKVSVSTSSKERGGGRVVATTLQCVHGMPQRKKPASTDNSTKSRRSDSQRTGCNCKINIRWPIKTDVHQHPRLTTMDLEHLHTVDKEAADVQQAQKGPLTTPMKETAAKLTDAGLKPAAQAVVIEALHGRRVHPRTMSGQRGRRATTEWPEGAKPKWAVTKNHEALSEGEQQAPLVATGRLQCATDGDKGGGGAGGGVQWDAGNVTIESSLVQLKETGPTPQDRRFLYVDCLKEATAAVSLGVETVPPEALRALVQQFKQGVHQASRIGSSAGLAVANPAVVRPPTSRDTGKRKRASRKGGAVVGAARRTYNQTYG
ncbi:hypothetical protein Esi_0156_0053 [Ectocarpus siliculosus]|uniref:FAR1 domain-containing protein n=1 Tax=Ectocarpus siliculosus TaxID=2880 RepID=D7FLA8_ECTSI|nr:hypothetical protein Esi_0156_0053 [Ectocarpus siliculosus]|eukprot:CBJ29679.1 hypothetical protein Esi_0156_0053 [Ectocarpus siliculosus]